MNLADPSKLTVASLEGLARLLSLLTNYFKVEIATKLIDHFKALSTDECLREVAFGPMADNDTIAKLVKLLNIFHLLPPAANVYLEQVMVMVVSTETKLHATSPTPFTPPLSAYLDRFPADGLTILFNHIKENRFVQTFRHVIQGKGAPTFVEQLKGCGTQLAQSMENAGSGHAGLPSILLCLDLTRVDPKWMTTQEDIHETLKVIWTSLFMGEVEESGFNSGRLMLIRTIYNIWMEVLRMTPRVDLLYTLTLIFTRPLQLDVSDLLDFIFLHMAPKTTLAFKHEVVLLFISSLEDGTFTEAHVLQYLRFVVIPLLTSEFRQAASPDEVVADGLIMKNWEKVWTQKADWSPALKMELLQLAGILAANAVARLRTDIPTRDLVKYIWSHFTVEETTLRNTALLAAARFLSHKDMSIDRFVGALWTMLLKPPADRESSPIIRQALDILTPVMARLVTSEGTPHWVIQVHRTLTDDVNTTVHICSLVLRHADLFYAFRELFFPQFVQSLPRLGFTMGQPKETRDMFLDLIDLISDWQKRAAQEQKDAMVVDSGTTNNRAVLATHSKDTVLTCLMRYALTSPESHNKPGLTARHFTQLKALVASEEWSDVPIRLNFFSRAFDTVSTSPSFKFQMLIL
jgi:transformation/transcription domain-associated protein